MVWATVGKSVGTFNMSIVIYNVASDAFLTPSLVSYSDTLLFVMCNKLSAWSNFLHFTHTWLDQGF